MAMSRIKRRAAKAKARHQLVEPAIRIHEAGHCVGHVLTTESLGWSTDEAITHVVIHPAPVGDGTVSHDGTHVLHSQATTFGMNFSRPMEDFLRARLPDKFTAESEIEWREIKELMREMPTAGIDVDWWFRAKSLELIFGPMAEAKFLGKPFDEVWNSYNSEEDRTAVRKYGWACGMNTDQIKKAFGEMFLIAEHYTAQPEVWQAIQAVADSLRYGHNDGRAIVKIIVRGLEPDAQPHAD
jgi:hypothetical protein